MALNGTKKIQEGYHSLERDVFFRIQRRYGHLDNKISWKYKYFCHNQILLEPYQVPFGIVHVQSILPDQRLN